MNTAALCNVNVEDFEAREGAREGARRQGKTLGSRLHGAVSGDVMERRSDALETTDSSDLDESARLSDRDLGRRSTSSARYLADERDQGDTIIRRPDISLARAIDAMERRTLRTTRRPSNDTPRPPSGFAYREEGRDHRWTDLDERLAEIESRLAARFAPVEDNPARAMLARLEARIDAIGRNSWADGMAMQSTFPHPSQAVAQMDPLRRLEGKLDSILAAFQSWPSEASPIALAASQAAATRENLRLEHAVGDIARRQRMLEDADSGPVSLKQAIVRRTAAPHRRIPVEEASAFTAMQNDIAALATRIETLCNGLGSQRSVAATPSLDLSALRAVIDAMSHDLRDLRQRADLSEVEQSALTLCAHINEARERDFSFSTLQSVRSAVEDFSGASAEIDVLPTIDRLSTQLRSICETIDRLEKTNAASSSIDKIRRHLEDVSDLISIAAAKPTVGERVGRLLEAIGELLNKQADETGVRQDLSASTEELRDFIAYPPGRVALDRIQTEFTALRVTIENALADAPAAAPSQSTSAIGYGELEQLLRDLGKKMEAVQASSTDHQPLEALQRQIDVLSARFETSNDGLAKLNGLQRSMQDVLAQLEKTHADVETSAVKAAREVLRIAIEDADKGGTANRSKVQSLQSEAEARTGSAISAVKETISKVVDRLVSIDADPPEAATPPRIASKDADLKPTAIALGAPDPLLDPVFGPMRKKPAANPTAPALQTNAEAKADQDRAGFIAAARRAAKTAQATLSLTELKRPDSSIAGKATRAILIERSRDYVERHKKPALLCLAALFVIVGTMAVIQRAGLTGGGTQSAGTAPHLQVASVSAPAAPSRIIDLGQPTAKPAATDAKSNAEAPATTTSSVPMFAAPLVSPPLPAIPAKLQSMAQAGDGGAEYVLGTRYAEGNGVPRNFKAAASWYQKAAAQGLAPAQYRLASLYEKGLGVDKDKVKARALYLQAAEAGNPRAMHNLAVLLADGDGKPDYAGAATWFRKAAQLGMQDSQFNLAILLARGLGVQQSLVQSYQWFAVAAARNDADAAQKRDEVGSKLGPADLAVAKTLAASFRPRTVSVAATEVQPPPGGWDGASASSRLNSARKISSL